MVGGDNEDTNDNDGDDNGDGEKRHRWQTMVARAGGRQLGKMGKAGKLGRKDGGKQ